jgi:hypothetical protein
LIPRRVHRELERRVDRFRAFDSDLGDQAVQDGLAPGDRCVVVEALCEHGPDVGERGRRGLGVLLLDGEGHRGWFSVGLNEFDRVAGTAALLPLSGSWRSSHPAADRRSGRF